MPTDTQRAPTEEEVRAVGKELIDLIEQYGDAAFDCGEWRNDDDTPFPAVADVSDAAHHALVIAIAKRVREARGEKELGPCELDGCGQPGDGVYGQGDARVVVCETHARALIGNQLYDSHFGRGGNHA